MKQLFIVVCLHFFMVPLQYAYPILHDFDAVMQPELYQRYMKKTYGVVGISADHLYPVFKNLFIENVQTLFDCSAQEKNKKIIHQIWLGSPVEGVIQEFVEQWKVFCAQHGWEYKLWTDADIKMLDFYNADLYNSAINFGMKSDIARLEILYIFGGFYVDIDCQPLTLFNELLKFDFVVGLQPLSTGFLQLSNAFLGASAHNALLKHAIVELKNNWIHHKGAPQKCGPVFLTRVLYTAITHGLVDPKTTLVLPSIYLYPYHPASDEIDIAQWKKQGSYIVHWWAKTWMPHVYRKGKFREIKNDIAASAAWND